MYQKTIIVISLEIEAPIPIVIRVAKCFSVHENIITL